MESEQQPPGKEPKAIPVDFDPFANAEPKTVPVDHDPFATAPQKPPFAAASDAPSTSPAGGGSGSGVPGPTAAPPMKLGGLFESGIPGLMVTADQEPVRGVLDNKQRLALHKERHALIPIAKKPLDPRGRMMADPGAIKNAEAAEKRIADINKTFTADEQADPEGAQQFKQKVELKAAVNAEKKKLRNPALMIASDEGQAALRAQAGVSGHTMHTDPNLYTFLPNSGYQPIPGVLQEDPRLIKLKADLWRDAEVTGDRKTQYSEETQRGMREHGAWTRRNQIDYDFDVLQHGHRVLFGRMLKYNDAIQDGVPEEDMRNEREDILAGMQYIEGGLRELVQRDPESMYDRLIQSRQRTTDTQGRGVVKSSAREFVWSATDMLEQGAAGALKLLDWGDGYSAGDRLSDYVAEHAEMRDTEIPSAHKAPIFQDGAVNAKAIVPSVAGALGQMTGLLLAAPLGGEGAMARNASTFVSSYLTEYENFTRSATQQGAKPEDAELYGKGYAILSALTEAGVNPQQKLLKGGDMKSAFLSAMKSGSGLKSATTEALGVFAKGGGQEALEEQLQFLEQQATNYAMNSLSGSNVDDKVTWEGLMNEAAAAFIAGGIAEVAGRGYQSKGRPSRARQEAMQWAVNNPDEAREIINTYLPENDQEQYSEALDELITIYKGNDLAKKDPEAAYDAFKLIAKKREVDADIKAHPADKAVAEAGGDPRVRRSADLQRQILDVLGLSLPESDGAGGRSASSSKTKASKSGAPTGSKKAKSTEPTDEAPASEAAATPEEATVPDQEFQDLSDALFAHGYPTLAPEGLRDVQEASAEPQAEEGAENMADNLRMDQQAEVDGARTTEGTGEPGDQEGGGENTPELDPAAAGESAAPDARGDAASAEEPGGPVVGSGDSGAQPDQGAAGGAGTQSAGQPAEGAEAASADLPGEAPADAREAPQLPGQGAAVDERTAPEATAPVPSEGRVDRPAPAKRKRAPKVEKPAEPVSEITEVQRNRQKDPTNVEYRVPGWEDLRFVAEKEPGGWTVREFESGATIDPVQQPTARIAIGAAAEKLRRNGREKVMGAINAAKLAPKEEVVDAFDEKLRRMKVHKPGSMSAATPFSIAWDTAIDAIRVARKAGLAIAEAIDAGLKSLRESDWWKSATPDEQTAAEVSLWAQGEVEGPKEQTPVGYSLGEARDEALAAMRSVHAKNAKDGKVTAREAAEARAAGLEAMETTGEFIDADPIEQERMRQWVQDFGVNNTAGRARRRLTKRMLEDPSVPQEIKDAFTPEAIFYNRLPQHMSMEAAAKLAEMLPGDMLRSAILDQTNGIHAATRNAMALQYYKKLEGTDNLAASTFFNDFARLGTEWGQGVAMFRMWSEMTDSVRLAKAEEQVLEERRKAGNPNPTITEEEKARLKDLNDKITKAPEGRPKMDATEDMLAYIANLKGVSAWDLLQAIWYAHILSGPITHLKNVTYNMSNLLLEVLPREMARAVVNPSRGAMMTRAAIKGVHDGLLEAVTVLTTGRSPIKDKAQTPGVLEHYDFKNIMRIFSKHKYVSRALRAADALFFEIGKEIRVAQLASAYATNKGGDIQANLRDALAVMSEDSPQWQAIKAQAEAEYQTELAGAKTGADRRAAAINKKRRIVELHSRLRDPLMNEEAHRFGERVTLNYKPEGLLGVFADALNVGLNAWKPLKYIVPFVNILANAANHAIDYSPAGYVRRVLPNADGQWFGGRSTLIPHKNEVLTQAEKDDLIWRASVGTALMVAAYMASDDDDGWIEITANGTGDFRKNFELKENGWQEYSVRVGDKWYSYQYTPLFFSLGYIGNIRDFEKYRDEKISDEGVRTKLATAAGWTATSMLDMTALTSLNDFMSAAMDPRNEDKLGDFMQGAKRTGTAVLVPNAYNQAAKTFESIMDMPVKEVKGTKLGDILQHTPWRDRYQDKVNALGETITPDQNFMLSTATSDPVWQLIAEKRMWIGVPAKSKVVLVDPETGVEKLPTPEEYHAYLVYRGQHIKQAITENFEALKAMSPKDAKEWAAEVKSAANSAAKAHIGYFKVNKFDIKDYLPDMPKAQ